MGTLHAAEQPREQNDQGVQLGRRRSDVSALAAAVSRGGIGAVSSPPPLGGSNSSPDLSSDIPKNVPLGRRRSASNVLAGGNAMPDVVAAQQMSVVPKGRRNSSGEVMGQKANLKNAVRCANQDDLFK